MPVCDCQERAFRERCRTIKLSDCPHNAKNKFYLTSQFFRGDSDLFIKKERFVCRRDCFRNFLTRSILAPGPVTTSPPKAAHHPRLDEPQSWSRTKSVQDKFKGVSTKFKDALEEYQLLFALRSALAKKNGGRASTSFDPFKICEEFWPLLQSLQTFIVEEERRAASQHHIKASGSSPPLNSKKRKAEGAEEA